jgi:hypothetical protein
MFGVVWAVFFGLLLSSNVLNIAAHGAHTLIREHNWAHVAHHCSSTVLCKPCFSKIGIYSRQILTPGAYLPPTSLVAFSLTFFALSAYIMTVAPLCGILSSIRTPLEFTLGYMMPWSASVDLGV